MRTATIHTLLLGLMLAAAPPAAATPDACLGEAMEAAFSVQPVAFEHEGTTLRGALYRPRSPGPHPAVVMLPGGGRERLGATPRFFARRLAGCGVAALVYDKRGTGRSGGSWETADFDDFVADASAALAYVQQHPAVAGRPVGVMGFSQGGRLAAVVAARTPAVAFVVSVSAPFASVIETRLYALERALLRRGVQGDALSETLYLWERHLHAIATNDAHRLAQLDPYLTPAARRAARPAVLPPAQKQVAPSPVYNSLGHDFSNDLRQLAAPLLAVYGERDARVPVGPSIDALQRLLGERPPQIVVVPFADHSFIDQTFYRRIRVEEIILPWIQGQLAGLARTAAPPVPATAGIE